MPSSLIINIVVDCRKNDQTPPRNPAPTRQDPDLKMSTCGERAFGRVGGEDVVEYSLANQR